MTATTPPNAEGYAAAEFDTADLWHSVEIQVHPARLVVYLSGHAAYRARRAIWDGPEAAAIGRSVCAGECPAGVLADWCEEHEPASRDWDFDPAKWLRRTIPPAELPDIPF